MPAVVLRAILFLVLACGPALAQAPGQPGGPPQVAVDPERLALAREVVKAAQGDRAAVLAGMKVPMTALMQQMGLKDPDKARVMVDEVVLPILAEHYDDLVSIHALSFAAVLGKEDLTAIAAFYATPAGKNLVKAQPQLTQAMLTGTQQWIGAIAPELRDRIAKAAQAHGWSGATKSP